MWEFFIFLFFAVFIGSKLWKEHLAETRYQISCKMSDITEEVVPVWAMPETDWFNEEVGKYMADYRDELINRTYYDLFVLDKDTVSIPVKWDNDFDTECTENLLKQTAAILIAIEKYHRVYNHRIHCHGASYLDVNGTKHPLYEHVNAYMENVSAIAAKYSIPLKLKEEYNKGTFKWYIVKYPTERELEAWLQG